MKVLLLQDPQGSTYKSLLVLALDQVPVLVLEP